MRKPTKHLKIKLLIIQHLTSTMRENITMLQYFA